jgi:hypothetical protein
MGGGSGSTERRFSRSLGAKDRARKESILRTLDCVPSMLPDVASVAMVLFDPWTKELTEVVSHERSILSRHDFFEKARDALPLNKALRKAPAASDPHLYAEPVYSSTSTILAILVAEADSAGRGFRSTDRQVLKTISAMLASFLVEGQDIEKGSSGDESAAGPDLQVTPKEKSFVATFELPHLGTKAAEKQGPTKRHHRLSRRWSGDAEVEDEVILDVVHHNFDPFSVPEEELIDIIVAMLASRGVLSGLNIPSAVMQEIVLDVRSQYHNVPFHNFQHVYTVLQMCYLLLTESATVQAAVVSPVARFTLLMAALCHDMNHPGNNNDYEIKSSSDLALRYNDVSVLENHHCSTMFQTMKRHNLRSHIEAGGGNWKEFRKIAVRAIFCTDMTRHKDLLQQVYEGLKEPEALPVEDWVAYIVHTADLGNLTLDWGIAVMWEERIFNEFEQQAQREEEEGLEVASYMSNLDEVSRAKIQLGFIDFVLLPWWEAMDKLIPVDLENRLMCLRKSKENYSHFLKVKTRETPG